MSKEIELRAVDTLLHNGMKFKAGWFTFLIKQSYLGTLLHISNIYLKMAIDEEKLSNTAYQGSFMLVPENAERVARVIAISVLNSKWKIKFFTRPLAKYLLWKLTPEKLFKVMGMVLILNNTASFTNSIRLIHTFRMMKPKEDLIENTKD